MSKGTTFLAQFLLFLVCHGCPSPEWIYCADNGHLCNIPWTSTFTETTIAFGVTSSDIWSFVDLSTTKPSTFSYTCESFGAGEPDGSNAAYVCCFNPAGSILGDHTHGLAANDSNWILSAYRGNNGHVPNDDYLYWVRFGWSDSTYNAWSYTLYSGEFRCNTHDMPYVSIYSPNTGCYYFKYPYNTGINVRENFIYCAGNGGTCNFNESPMSDSPGLRLVAYGDPSDLYYYIRFLYMPGNQVYCSSLLMPDGNYAPPNPECYLLEGSYSNFFTQNLGYWNLASSCFGTSCGTYTYTMSWGTTATSSYATQSQWTESVTDSVSAEFGFVDDKTTISTSYTTSESIGTSMTEAFSKTTSHTCEATCEATSYSPNIYLWQLIVSSNQIIGTGLDGFKTPSCFWICLNTTAVPQCPYGYCANQECSQCTDYQ